MSTRKYLCGGSALGRNRTCDQEIRRLLLYPLSYEGNLSSLDLPHDPAHAC